MVFFYYESFSSALVFKSQPYSEAMAMRPDVTYTPCATSLSKKNVNIEGISELKLLTRKAAMMIQLCHHY